MTKIAEFDATESLARANRVLPPIIGVILLIVLAWQLAKLVWLLVPGAAAGDPIVAPSAAANSTARSAGIDVQAIANTNLFGQADADEVVVVDDPGPDLPKSTSNLTLKGTVASRDDDYSVALISTGGNNQDVFAIGDSITSGTSLHAVYADRVVLNENGLFTNLELPKEYQATRAPAVRRATTTRQSPQNAQSIQNVVSQNLTKLTDVIRPTPYMQNGKPAGYRVYPGRDRKQFAALGLRPGDIIKDIDGQSLTDPTQAMKIFQSLGTTEQVTVTIERAGQAETLVLKTDQLDLSGEQTK